MKKYIYRREIMIEKASEASKALIALIGSPDDWTYRYDGREIDFNNDPDRGEIDGFGFLKEWCEEVNV